MIYHPNPVLYKSITYAPARLNCLFFNLKRLPHNISGDIDTPSYAVNPVLFCSLRFKHRNFSCDTQNIGTFLAYKNYINIPLDFNLGNLYSKFKVSELHNNTEYTIYSSWLSCFLKKSTLGSRNLSLCSFISGMK